MIKRTLNNKSRYQLPDYAKLMYGDENLDWKWFYEVKEVDRRLSYPLVTRLSVVCDVGGAKGIDAFAFAEKGAVVINLDINKHALRQGKELACKYGLNSKLSFIKSSATHLPFKSETLDLVTCFSTLDHLPNRKSVYEAIREFSRVIRQHGHVAITVPNKAFLIGTMIMKIKGLMDKETFFEQRFTPKELFEILSKCGLSPLIFDSEFPKSVSSSILLFNFPKICRKIPGIMTLLFFGAMFLRKIAKMNQAKLFGARMGYLSIKRTIGMIFF